MGAAGSLAAQKWGHHDMSDRVRQTLAQIEGPIRAAFEDEAELDPFVPGETRLPLSVPSYGADEVLEALESLLSTQVTMGSKVRAFEEAWAKYIGVKHAVMVNSGSSANLLALKVLTNEGLDNPLRPGDEVITPAVTWATTVWPIADVGLVPVLVDVDIDTLNISSDQVQEAISPLTRAIMPVHLLGNPVDMDAILKIANANESFVLEDACESHGAEIGGRKTGSIGNAGTFSFFFSHHISTIEGGMIVTDRDDIATLARSLRTFGWIRDRPDRAQLASRYSEIDPRFLFVSTGFNMRPTEIQGAFGIHQLPKLDPFVNTRRHHAKILGEALKVAAPEIRVIDERPGTRHSRFAYSLIVDSEAPFSRNDLVAFLEHSKIETRPIMAGNIADQPGMKYVPHRVVGDLRQARLISDNGLFFGLHHQMSDVKVSWIASQIIDFVTSRR